MNNAYSSLLLKLLHAIAKYCQINCRIEKTKTRGSIFFCKDKIDKVSSWEFCNKNIEFTFKIFRMKVFHIYKLKSQGRTRFIRHKCLLTGLHKLSFLQL